MPSQKKQVRLTEFEGSVLKTVCKIPIGQTRSYRWVAKGIDRPKAVRAVGQALKKNPYPGIIPCHRVIREDGSLGGYSARGGIKKKIQLLKLERKIARELSPKKSKSRL